MHKLYRNSLVFRNASLVMGVALCVASLFALVSFHLIADQQLLQTRANLKEALVMMENTTSIACYLQDQNLAKEVAEGFLKNQSVNKVSIETGTKRLAFAQRKPPQAEAEAQEIIVHEIFSPFNPIEKVCQIRVSPNLQLIRSLSASKAQFIVYLLLAQGLGITLALLAIISYTVTRPIQCISDGLHGLRLNSAHKLATPIGHEGNEIGSLVNDINALTSSLDTALQQERDLRLQHAMEERRYKTIFDNAETALFQLSSDGKLLSYNQAFTRMLKLQHMPVSELAESLIYLLHGQELRLHLMIDQALQEGKVTAEDFCIQLPKSGEKRWFHVVISAVGEAMLQGVMNDISDRKLKEESANKLAVTDYLTGLHNRLGLEQELQRLAQQNTLHPLPDFFVLLIDLDKFKQVNDSYGHNAGDFVLQHFARLLSNCLRQSDFLARLGGDEFVVLLKEVSQHDVASQIAQKIRQHARQLIQLPDGNEVEIDASIGLSQASMAQFSPHQLLEDADRAMYHNKQLRRQNQA